MFTNRENIRLGVFWAWFITHNLIFVSNHPKFWSDRKKHNCTPINTNSCYVVLNIFIFRFCFFSLEISGLIFRELQLKRTFITGFESNLRYLKPDISKLKKNFQKIKLFNTTYLFKIPGFKYELLTPSELWENPCSKLLTTLSQFESLLEGRPPRSGINPGSDPDFPEICPSFRGDISELKGS